MVTMLTGTIPTLRPLYNRLRGYGTNEDKCSSQRGSRSRGYRLENMESEQSNKNTPSLTPQSRYATASVIANTDYHGDESILGGMGVAIVRTDEVTVEYKEDWSSKKQTNGWSRQPVSEQEAV